MLLNARSDLDSFQFPRGFVPENLINKYGSYLGRLDLPYDTILDVINYSIVGLDIPNLQFETVTQVVAGFDDKARGRVITYRSAKSFEDSLDSKKIVINFKALDGLINYWAMREIMTHYYSYQVKTHYILDLSLRDYDSDGIVMSQVIFRGCIMKNLSGVTRDFSNPNNNVKEFSLELEFIEMDVDLNFLQP